MKRVRIIPVLTLDNEKLVKTIKFNHPNYIGDPINAVKIFNEKEVDELVLLDITATKNKREPNYFKIEEIASEAFMPFAYGGGIHNLNQIEKLFKLGIEKVILNSALDKNLDLITSASNVFGSQSIVVSVDVKLNIFNKYSAYTNYGSKKVKENLNSYLAKIERAGAGELFINSINRDGTYLGYDYQLISSLTSQISIPIVVCGGASKAQDFLKAIQSGASAAAAGSLFIYTGKTKGILINYPSQETLLKEVYEKL